MYKIRYHLLKVAQETFPDLKDNDLFKRMANAQDNSNDGEARLDEIFADLDNKFPTLSIASNNQSRSGSATASYKSTNGVEFMRGNIHHQDLPLLNSTHPRSTKKQMQSKKARLAQTGDTTDSDLSSSSRSSSDSVSTHKSRLRANKLHQHYITYTTSRTTYTQVARDWVATSALAMRPPEDLSEITPSEPTWRAHSVVQTEMSSLCSELLQMQHNMHSYHQVAQELLQDTVHNMQQDTEEIKGNLLLMMDMLWKLHPKFSVLQPPYTLHSPPNGSLIDRTPQPTVITPFHHTSPQTGKASQHGQAS